MRERVRCLCEKGGEDMIFKEGLVCVYEVGGGYMFFLGLSMGY